MLEPSFKDLWKTAKDHGQAPLYYAEALVIISLVVLAAVSLFRHEWVLVILAVMIALMGVRSSKLQLQLLWYRHRYTVTEEK